MKLPWQIRKEKLEEINLQAKKVLLEFNLIKEKLVKLDEMQNHINAFIEKFDKVYEDYFKEEPAMSEEEMKKMIEAEREQMKLLVREAISDMLADPKNQENIQKFFSSFTAQGAGIGNPINEDGSLNTGVVWQQLQKHFLGKGDGTGPAPRSGEKTTGY